MAYLSGIDYWIIVLYFILSLIIGFFYKGKASKDIAGFFLGGRSLPWYVAGLSMVATTFAADTPLAVTELVNQKGISGNWLWWNFLIGGMLTTFFFARLWRRAGILTEIEFVAIRYEGKAAKFLRYFKSLYLGLFINTLIMAWVNLALISILQVFFGISDSEVFWYVFGAMLITAFYSSLSGLLGVAILDMIQFVIAISGSIVLAYFVVHSSKIGGMNGLIAKLPTGSTDFLPHISNNVSSIGTTMSISIGALLAYIGIQWWASWYPGAEPGGGGYVAQRMMSTKTEKDSFLATLFFQIFHYIVRPWPWIIVALATIVLYPDLAADQKRIGYILAIKDFLPAGVKGLLLVSIFAAYMSTISTHLNWGASYLVNDFLLPVFKKISNNNSKQVFFSRVFTVGIMLLSAYVTTLVTSISGVWKFLLETGAGLGLVLILRWYWWRINIWAEISATFFPFIFYAISKFIIHLEFPASYFFTVGLTTIGWIIVMYATPPTKDQHLYEFVKKVRPGGWWIPVYEKYNIAPPSNSVMYYNFINWISAVIGAYSLLFAIGKLLFKDYNSFFVLTFVSILSFGVTYKFVKKVAQ